MYVVIIVVVTISTTKKHAAFNLFTLSLLLSLRHSLFSLVKRIAMSDQATSTGDDAPTFSAMPARLPLKNPLMKLRASAQARYVVIVIIVLE
jgi:hypothetical protein